MSGLTRKQLLVGAAAAGVAAGCGSSPRPAAYDPRDWASVKAQFALAKGVRRLQSLATRLKEGLADLRNVRLVTPLAEEVSAGIVCFEVDGLDPPAAVERLRREHKLAASVTPYAQPYVRLGTGLWVDEADVDAALGAVSKL